MGSTDYHAIIVGGGHNGLVTACYLSKAGYKVILFESRSTLGGAASTEEIFPGFQVNTGAHDSRLFHNEIVDSLELGKYGLEFIKTPAITFSPNSNGDSLTLWTDIEKSRKEISRLSERDAKLYPEYLQFIKKMRSILDEVAKLTPPDLFNKNINDIFSWSRVFFKLKRLGKRDMMQFMRILSMSAVELLDEWFENEALKAALGSPGVTGSMQGPKASGTAYMMLYQYASASKNGFNQSRFVRGGLGQISRSLATVAVKHNVEIKTDTMVEQIILDGSGVDGVRLEGGEVIRSNIVVSNADPRRTFFDLVGAQYLEPRFVRLVRNIRFKGSTAKLNLALTGLPDFKNVDNPAEQLSGHTIICPDLEYLERAYDDAKYGRFSDKPYLDIVIPTLSDPQLAPEGKHLMSIIMRYAPFRLKEDGWSKQRDNLEEKIIDTIAKYAPNIRDIILHHQLITPLDWETEYGLTRGGIFHGQMGLDRMLFMRPVAGWGQYRTPIKNLYLCGAGTHPGGGVTGLPGLNAAREIIKDLKGS